MMRLSGLYILCLGYFFACISKQTEAFSCYICDSKDDNQCVENLPSNNRLKPQLCQNITNAKYCIKTTNLYAGELGTKRFCAANDHGNYCSYVKQPTGDRYYRSCVLTCSSENCNSAKSSTEYVFYVGFFSFLFNFVFTANIYKHM